MSLNAAGIIFSNLSSNTISEMTDDRTVAAIPFGCRYRIVDFCLSNLVNANISNISVVANYNYRSLVDHIGSGKDFDLARRNGGINIMSPMKTSKTAASHLYESHLQVLVSMKEYINEFKEDVVILMDADHVMNIALTPIIEQHLRTDANITFVTAPVDRDFVSPRPQMMFTSVAGKITEVIIGTSYNEKAPEVSLNILILSTAFLRRMIAEAEENGLGNLTEYILRTCKYSNYRSFCYHGYVAPITSLLNYYRCSMQLVEDQRARESLLWQKDAPIYTKVHNSSPTKYSADAVVQNSMIADDCVIEGTVINSIIARNVHIAKGAVVRNSVLFWGCNISKDAMVNCVVADKDVFISEGVQLSGNANLPIYIEKKRKV